MTDSKPHSELVETIYEALIDAHPGPLDEHDPMCAIRFALPGVCNCSVARNKKARKALTSLEEQLEAARRDEAFVLGLVLGVVFGIAAVVGIAWFP